MQIISGRSKKRKGEHKVTFLDQIENQIKTYKDPAYADTNPEVTKEGNKTVYNLRAVNKKIISLK